MTSIPCSPHHSKQGYNCTDDALISPLWYVRCHTRFHTHGVPCRPFSCKRKKRCLYEVWLPMCQIDFPFYLIFINTRQIGATWRVSDVLFSSRVLLYPRCIVPPND